MTRSVFCSEQGHESYTTDDKALELLEKYK